MPKCCVDCFSDRFIRKHVKSVAEPGMCDYCEAAGTETADVDEVGPFVVDGLVRAYVPATEEAGPYDHEDGRYMWNDPSEGLLACEVMESEGAFSESLSARVRQRLAVDLIKAGTSFDDRKIGAAPLGDGSDYLALRDGYWGAQDTGFDEAWSGFKHRVLHVARFWDHASHGITRKQLIAPVLRFARLASQTLAAGTRLWRARRIAISEPLPVAAKRADAIGPAPLDTARRGSRMSPPGVSYPYLSNSEETCRAELAYQRPKRLWIGELETRIDLKILDLTGDTSAASHSVWSPRYRHHVRWGPELLRGFAREISLPVRRRDIEVGYVPTQVLAERIRLEGFHGIRYASAPLSRSSKQFADKPSNYVLFCGHPVETENYAGVERGGPTPLPRWQDWLTLKTFRDIPWRASPRRGR